eukprot:5907051-Pyramimonas_sp.AAC.1
MALLTPKAVFININSLLPVTAARGRQGCHLIIVIFPHMQSAASPQWSPPGGTAPTVPAL